MGILRLEVVREAARTDVPTEIKESKESEVQQQRPSQSPQKYSTNSYNHCQVRECKLAYKGTSSRNCKESKVFEISSVSYSKHKRRSSLPQVIKLKLCTNSNLAIGITEDFK